MRTTRRVLAGALLVVAVLASHVGMSAARVPAKTPRVAAPTTTAFYLDSEEDDYEGGGHPHLFSSPDLDAGTPDAGTIGMSASNHSPLPASVLIWTGTGQPFHIGTYVVDTRLGDDTPHVGAGYGYTGCFYFTGWFVVDQVAYDGDTIASLSIRFEVHCDGADAALFGFVSYNSPAPYPTRSVDPSVTFDKQLPATVGPTEPLTITDDGPAALTIGPATLTGIDASQFQIVSDGCAGVTLQATQSCTIGVRFQPTTLGVKVARLTFFDDLTPAGGTGRDVVLHGTAARPDPKGELTPLTPSRILDTRDGTGQHGSTAPLGNGATIALQVTGAGGVPSSGVSAVIMNVTVTNENGPGHLTVWPAGYAMPTASSVNYVQSHDVANLVTVQVGSGGRVSIWAQTATHVVVDVVGFYASSSGPVGARYHGLTIPTRTVDTRDGTGGFSTKVGPGGTIRVKVTGVAGIPANGVVAVVFNLTVTEPTGSGHLTAYPDDVGLPTASNVNYAPHQDVPNLVTLRVPASGYVDIHNSNSGSTHVIVDEMGWYGGLKLTEAGRFVPVLPTRFVDTRLYDAPMEDNTVEYMQAAGIDPLPLDGVAAVVMNVTVTEPTSPGFLTVFPPQVDEIPDTSNLNFVPGQTVPNMVICLVDPDKGYQTYGAVLFYNPHGRTHVVVDVDGYFTA